MSKKESIFFYLILFIILLSRLPFIFDGYGSEEDAWALPLVAERIATSGQYEVSRLPGHPFQEIVYTFLYQSNSVVFNLITVLISTLGIAYFMMACFQLKIKNWDLAGIALAFTPIIYINSINDMDYMWAMAFILMAFYFVVNRMPILAALFVSFAVGCRITSGAFVLPFTLLLFNLVEKEIRNKEIIKFILVTFLGSLLIFSPVILTYGINFFTYYEHFPIPGFAKNFYKGTFGAFGILGLLIIILLIIDVLLHFKNYWKSISENKIHKTVLSCSLISIFLSLIAFLKVPLKSAFVIPMVPFVWILFAILIPRKKLLTYTIGIVLSPFIFGINLADPLRGSASSSLSYKQEINGFPVSFDILEGPLLADQSKKKFRTQFSKKVLEATNNLQQKTFILAGWWLADILVLQKGTENKFVTFKYYTNEQELNWYKENEYVIYFLPEQDQYNDLRFKSVFTNKYATPFPL
jgi:hypothetical protein